MHLKRRNSLPPDISALDALNDYIWQRHLAEKVVDFFTIKLIFLRYKSYFSTFWICTDATFVFFINFLLLDATDRSKISISDQKRLFFAVSPPFNPPVYILSHQLPIVHYCIVPIRFLTCRVPIIYSFMGLNVPICVSSISIHNLLKVGISFPVQTRNSLNFLSLIQNSWEIP